MSSFFSLLFRQKLIRRWGLMRSSQPENLAEHASEVAAITHALALIGNRELGKNYDPGKAALLGLYHDAPEVFTGDLPTPVKYFSPEMRESYAKIEKNAVCRLLNALPAEYRDDYAGLLDPDDCPELRLVKAADKLSALIKCIEEAKSGNREFASAEKSLRGILAEMDCPEADIFAERCLPAFSLTLDEQHC
ncbi:MAG: 5'-deoxynucleotidase [Clostridiales bacterium]|nr:5'-deoxynucleotidase [Clostridiales bacterium]